MNLLVIIQEWFFDLKPVELIFIGLNLVMVGIGFWGIWLTGRSFSALLGNLESVRKNGRGAATHPALLQALTEYDRALVRGDIRIHEGVIVDRALQNLRPEGSAKRVDSWVRVVRMATSLCLVLGLLGTFVGLMSALFGLSSSLEGAANLRGDAKEMQALMTQLRAMLGGMSTVFQASVWGVGGSALLTLVSSLSGTLTARDSVAAELEHFLCHEYESPAEAAKSVQQQLVDSLWQLNHTLKVGLADGLSEAAQIFGDTAARMGDVLQQVQPVTESLQASGYGLQVLTRGMESVTDDMRNLLIALNESQALLPQRLESLQDVEGKLLVSFDALQKSIVESIRAQGNMAKGAEMFYGGAQQLDSVVQDLKGAWPGIIREFISETERAVETQALTVSEAVERLRRLMEASQSDSLMQMQHLVSVHSATAQAVAASLNGRRQ